MNEKNREKRQSATIKKTAHRRLKYLSWKQDRKLEDLIDEAIFAYLKATK